MEEIHFFRKKTNPGYNLANTLFSADKIAESSTSIGSYDLKPFLNKPIFVPIFSYFVIFILKNFFALQPLPQQSPIIIQLNSPAFKGLIFLNYFCLTASNSNIPQHNTSEFIRIRRVHLIKLFFASTAAIPDSTLHSFSSDSC